MTRLARSFPIFIAVYVVAAQPAPGARPADEPAVEGTWRWSWTDQGGTEHKRALKLRKEGGKLVGSVSADDGEDRPAKEVRLEGKTLRVLSTRERDGETVEVVYEGKVEGDSIEGTVTFGSVSRPWTPRRDAARPDAAPPAEKSDGWVPLIKGYNLAESGWKLRHEPDEKHKSSWTLKDGVLTNTVPEGAVGIDIYHHEKLLDFELHVEFRVPKGSNSGVYLRGSYEVQVDDAQGRKDLSDKMCGAIYGLQAPSVNAAASPGEWQSFDIRLEKNKVTVTHNGKKIIDGFELKQKTGGSLDEVKHGEPGPLMLQGDHGNVEYRNIKIRPLAVKL
jgi:hypothetical protein